MFRIKVNVLPWINKCNSRNNHRVKVTKNKTVFILKRKTMRNIKLTVMGTFKWKIKRKNINKMNIWMLKKLIKVSSNLYSLWSNKSNKKYQFLLTRFKKLKIKKKFKMRKKYKKKMSKMLWMEKNNQKMKKTKMQKSRQNRHQTQIKRAIQTRTKI